MKKNRVGKIIGFIGICVFIAGLSYILTKYLDKNMYLNTELLVTLEDTKEFELEEKSKLTKDEAIKTYPNTIKIENKSLKKVKYIISLKEIKSTLEDDDLSYILYLNDKEIKDGKVKDLKDNLFNETTIGIKKTDTYKLYMYLNNEKKDFEYKYSIVVDSE